jgi:PAS domain S-box-containing protein
MANDLNGILSQAELRQRAVTQLTGAPASLDARMNASAAFRVLHDLASSPSTAAAAMALLHELQVHQVELDMQDEEMRRSRDELEATLARQMELYDLAPVGCFSVDGDTALRELNLTAARMLGLEREQLLGRPLDSFLTPQSAQALRAMLARVCTGAQTRVDELQVLRGRGVPRSVHASASRPPHGQHFLIAFVDAAEQGEQTLG